MPGPFGRAGHWAVAAGAAMVVGMGAAGAACGSSSNAGGFSEIGSGTGSSGGSSSGSTSGGFGDGAGLESPDGGDAGEAGPPATSALFVNAMPAAFSSLDSAIRLCWGKPGADGGIDTNTFDKTTTLKPFPSDTPMPESNYPGIPLGASVLLPDASALEGPVVLIAIRALTLASNKYSGTCADLFLPQVELASTDYFVLSNISLAPQTPSLVAIGGCGPVAVASGATNQACGANWDPAYGNLHAEVLALSPSSAAPGTMGFQVAQLSPGLAASLGDGGLPAEVWFGSAGTSDPRVIASVSSEGDLAPATPQALALDGSIASYAGLGFGLRLPGGDGGTDTLFLSLSSAQELVDPTADPLAYYSSKGTYVVAVVGDPAAPAPFGDGGVYDGTGLHFLVAQAQP